MWAISFQEINIMNRYLFFIIFLPVLFVLAIYAPTHQFFSNQYDDSYITYRYAINLAQAQGMVFNIGEYTDSASSFLYTLVLSAVYLFGIHNLEFIGGLCGVLSLSILLFLVFKLSVHLTSDRRVAAFVTIACGLNGLLSGWTLSGMETLPWATLIFLAVYLIIIDAHPTLIALSIALAAFTRLEGIFLVACYGSLLLTRPKRRLPFLCLGVVIVTFLLFYLVKKEYYGVWISHAFQMKEQANYYKSAPHELISNWLKFASIPFVLSIPIIFSKKYFYVGAYVGISIASILFGPKSDWSRYSVHLLPLLYAFSSPVLANINNRNYFTHALKAIMIVQALAGTLFMWRNNTALAEHQICRKEVGQYIKTNLTDENYIASSDLGAISYVAINHQFVDLIALTSSDVLYNYSKGRTADSILVSKNVKYLANTFSVRTTSDEIDDLLAQFPNVKDKSTMTIDHAYLFSCKSNNLTFSIAKIIPKTFK
jgi:hypothetical protein